MRAKAATRVVAVVMLAVLAPSARARAQDPSTVTLEQVRRAIDAAPATHPRLLVGSAGFATLRQRVAREGPARDLYELLYAQADAMLALDPVQHIVTGRRLLSESRKALRRVLTHSLVYRLSGEQRFLDGARREMLAAARFPDWNPSHFLDTAEMSLALALGYDWLFDALAASDRATIGTALLEKGIGAADEQGECLTATNNWGQVCTAGIGAAALALLEDDRALAARVVHRAVTGVPRSMHASYAPDGTYPEGPGYWHYGTSFNVVLIAELESALGTDFGLTNEPGFDRTAEYINHATGASGLFFNYADGGPGRGPLPELQWFATRFDRPDWLLFEEQVLAEYVESEEALQVAGSGARLLPLALVWMGDESGSAPIRMGLHWVGKGEIPVAMHRTSWTDPNAVFVGVKAGFAAGPHGQMDAGSFVLDADGERWAHDLGAEDYNRIESLGMDLWNRDQDSDRWLVFRNNNLSHGTLTIGGQPHRVAGRATIIAHSESPEFPHTVLDLSPVFAGQAERVLRGVGLVNGGEVLIQDRLEGVTRGPVRWGMVTRAEVELSGPREAVLRQDGKHLRLRVLSPVGAQLQIFETETPPSAHDSPNPGTRMIGFVAQAGGEPLDFVVRLTPGSRDAVGQRQITVRPLEEW